MSQFEPTVRERLEAWRDQADEMQMCVLESLERLERSRALLDRPVYGLTGAPAGSCGQD